MSSPAPPAYDGSGCDEDAPEDAPPPFQRRSIAFGEKTGTLSTNGKALESRSKVRADGRLDINIEGVDSEVIRQLDREQPGTPPEAEALRRTLARSTVIPGPLNMVIQVVGSRGDVQPFIALGLVLNNQYGHRIGSPRTAHSRNSSRKTGSRFSI